MVGVGGSLRVVPLGGFGEIGMNCLTLEVDGRLIVIDCGVMFPPREALGVDLIHPSFDYLVSRQSDLEALILTHGHEDHVAAVPYLLREVDLPVYGAPYTLGLVRNRLADFDGAGRLDAHVLQAGTRTELGPFAIEGFAMPHSIVDNMGLVIETPVGRILHTGDFKLGLNGPDRGAANIDRLSRAAAGRVDLMISDSTGAEEDEIAGEESGVAEVLTDLVQRAEGRVFIAVFASNVARIQAIIGAARETGRKVALCGRSVQNHARVAEGEGALTLPADIVIPLEEASRVPVDRLIVVISGTQGEPRSALGRLSTNGHRDLRVEKGDLVVLSSRFIPGNEVAISAMIDRLLRLGAKVVHRGNLPGVHVSGHGSRDEIKTAIEAVAPRAFIPAHGTLRHMVAGAGLATGAGVPQVTVICDGQVAVVSDSKIEVERRGVAARRVYIDSGSGLPENAIRDRRNMGARGVLFVTWLADEEGLARGEPEVITKGLVAEEAVPWLVDQIREEVTRVLERMPVATRTDATRCRENMRSSLRKYTSRRMSRDPFVFVTVLFDRGDET